MSLQDKPFSFLANASPKALHNLLQNEGADLCGTVLANVAFDLQAKVLAYFSDEKQRELVIAIGSARRAGPERAADAAARIRAKLLEMKKNAADGPAAGTAATSPVPPKTPVAPPPANRPRAASNPYAAGKDGLKPWRPRVADGPPINAHPKPPVKPIAAAGSVKPPLVGLNLKELFGFARDVLAGKTPRSPSAAKADGAAERVEKPAGADKPRRRDAIVKSRDVNIAATPRTIGKPAAVRRQPLPIPPGKPAIPGNAAEQSGSGGAKRIDGMAILASILREADVDIRHNVAIEHPELYRQLQKRMFHFDDLALSDDAALSQVFTIAPADVAALALRFAAPRLRERALGAVSPQRAELLRSEASSPRGSSGLDAIEAAQDRVLEIALQLQKAGRIVIDPDDPDLAL